MSRPSNCAFTTVRTAGSEFSQSTSPRAFSPLAQAPVEFVANPVRQPGDFSNATHNFTSADNRSLGFEAVSAKRAKRAKRAKIDTNFTNLHELRARNSCYFVKFVSKAPSSGSKQPETRNLKPGTATAGAPPLNSQLTCSLNFPSPTGGEGRRAGLGCPSNPQSEIPCIPLPLFLRREVLRACGCLGP